MWTNKRNKIRIILSWNDPFSGVRGGELNYDHACYVSCNHVPRFFSFSNMAEAGENLFANLFSSSIFKYCTKLIRTPELMVFTVTLSDCKVKKARFYEFLFTLGWRLIGNTSLNKFSAPKHVSFQKYSSLNFRVFTVRDTKIGSYLLEKKSLRLIFSSLTISSIRRYVYAQVC